MEISNLTGLEKPTTILIEGFISAVGMVWEPYQMTRIAKAENDIAFMKYEANFELKQRAITDNEKLLTLQQSNKEAIAYKAIEGLTPNAKPELLDNDWISYFFEKSKNISDTDMQLLWARLLAQEANENNSVSKRTLSFLETMDKKDALLFQKLCQCVLVQHLPNKPNNYTVPLITSMNNEDTFLKSLDLNHNDLNYLEGIGLIKLTVNGDWFPPNSVPMVLSCGEKSFLFKEITILENHSIGAGCVVFTVIGLELFKIANVERHSFFLEYAETYLKCFQSSCECTLMDTEEALKKLNE
jgi:Protein of unknown function (DUF2806)